MACDGWFPKALRRISPDTAVPKLAVVGFCALTAVFVALSFGSLAVIQCLTYAGALTLEFLALITLRIRYPNAPRSFRVPGVVGDGVRMPHTICFCSARRIRDVRDWRSIQGQLLVVGVAVLGGVILYFARRRTPRLYRYDATPTQ